MTKVDEGTRTRLLETAGEIFAEQGFAATTVRQICRAAEVNLAAVNYHFRDKQNLYIESLKHAHSCRFTDLPVWPPGTPAPDKLTDFVRIMLTNLLDRSRPPWTTRLILREMIDPSEGCKALTEQKIRPMFRVLLKIVGELLPPNTPLRQRHLFAFSVVGQCLFYRTQEHVLRQLLGAAGYEQLKPQQLAAHIVAFTLAGLPQRRVGARARAKAGGTR